MFYLEERERERENRKSMVRFGSYRAIYILMIIFTFAYIQCSYIYMREIDNNHDVSLLGFDVHHVIYALVRETFWFIKLN